MCFLFVVCLFFCFADWNYIDKTVLIFKYFLFIKKYLKFIGDSQL